MSNNSKYCNGCKQTKLISEFSKCSSRKDGLQTQCKSCKKLTSTKWAKDNPEANSRSSRKWQIANPEYAKLSHHLWQKNNPEKNRNSENKRRAIKAQNQKYLISKKFLRKLYSSPCVVCHSTENIQMDHVIPISKSGQHSEGEHLNNSIADKVGD